MTQKAVMTSFKFEETKKDRESFQLFLNVGFIGKCT